MLDGSSMEDKESHNGNRLLFPSFSTIFPTYETMYLSGTDEIGISWKIRSWLWISRRSGERFKRPENLRKKNHLS